MLFQNQLLKPDSPQVSRLLYAFLQFHVPFFLYISIKNRFLARYIYLHSGSEWQYPIHPTGITFTLLTFVYSISSTKALSVSLAPEEIPQVAIPIRISILSSYFRCSALNSLCFDILLLIFFKLI